jgi:hypothetical protein
MTGLWGTSLLLGIASHSLKQILVNDQVKSRLLGLACTVLGATLLSVFHTQRIKGTPYNGVTDTGKVFHSTTANENNGVFLEVVADAGDIGGYFYACGEANPGHLPEC